MSLDTYLGVLLHVMYTVVTRTVVRSVDSIARQAFGSIAPSIFDLILHDTAALHQPIVVFGQTSYCLQYTTTYLLYSSRVQSSRHETSHTHAHDEHKTLAPS